MYCYTCNALMLALISVKEGLDEIIDLMETLLKDYSKARCKVLSSMATTPSLKQELSTVECTMSGAISSYISVALIISCIFHTDRLTCSSVYKATS